MAHRIKIMILPLLLIVSGNTGAVYAKPEFSVWLEENIWPKARASGVSRHVFKTATKGLKPDPKVLEAKDNQPEFVRPIWEYISRATSKKRLETGQRKLKENRKLLARIEKSYGVDRHVVVAIWGMESNFGSHLGNKNVIRALATLAYKGGRREKFGREQLVAALKILQRGDITPAKMKGSWAGAMGHTQFIPTTYEAYAVDFNKDGKRDIWGTVPDALASAANYIKASGWRSGETWGYEVKLPAKFDFSTSGRGRKKTIRQWEKLGVKRAGGKTFPRKSDVASLISPAGSQGPSFLILSNFNAIMRYNNSVAYALAIGHLADRLPGYVGGFHQSWPTGDKPLALSERKELQELLAEKGYAIGKVDGVMGIKTSRAIRSWQKSKGLPADGYPSLKLLEAIRNER